MIKPSPCKGCGKELYYLRHVNAKPGGRPAPIEVEPSPNGNVLIDLEAGTWAVVSRTQRETHAPGTLHLNHYANCPNPPPYTNGGSGGDGGGGEGLGVRVGGVPAPAPLPESSRPVRGEHHILCTTQAPVHKWEETYQAQLLTLLDQQTAAGYEFVAFLPYTLPGGELGVIFRGPRPYPPLQKGSAG